VSFDVSAFQWGSLTGEPHLVPSGRVGADPTPRVHALDVEIHSTGDAIQAASAAHPDDPQTTILFAQWLAFFTRWQLWFNQHGTDADAATSSQFLEFQSQYTLFRSMFNALGGEPAVPPSSTPSAPSPSPPLAPWYASAWNSATTALGPTGAVVAATTLVAGAVLAARELASRRARERR
jgi:hypothetical protein